MEEIHASALEELAIFPLPDLVLFPNALLPLHIFEPRYRDMMADVLSGSKLIGVARLMPGFEEEYDGRPGVYSICGIGRCIAADRLPDGRYNVMLRGLARMHIDTEHPPATSYRRVRARILGDDRSERPESLTKLHAELLALCDRLSESVPEGEPIRQLVRAVPQPGGCADIVASALVRDADIRQILLELLDPAERLDKVIDYVSMLIGQFGPGNRIVN